MIFYGIILFESCSFLQVLQMPCGYLILKGLCGYAHNVALQPQHQLVQDFTSLRLPLTQRWQCELLAQRGVLLAEAGGVRPLK